MKRRTFSNIVLLVVAASLGIFIVTRPGQEQHLVLEPLSHENPRSVSHIRLELAAGSPIELRRMDGAWHLLEPVRIAANDFRIDGLLRVLNAPVHARIDTDTRELNRFGLAPPQARVIFDGKKVLFGDTDAIHGRRYLLFDEKVALVDDNFFSYLSASAATYVNPALLGHDPQLQEIVLPGIRVYRQAGDWHLESSGASANVENIERLINSWAHAQATAVRPYESSLEWNDSVRVELADGPIEFNLAHTEYEVILGRRDLGIQYHLTKGTGERLLSIEPPKEAKASL